MVKLKTKVTLKPRDFIKYLLDFEEVDFTLMVKTEGGYNNTFEPKLKVKNYITYNEKDETFTVGVQEDITEETVLTKALSVAYNDSNDRETYTVEKGRSVKEIIEKDSSHFFDTKAIYLINDDRTLELIWKDGKLVD
ncbi:hypothetical protein AB0O08_34050 [Streptomyces anulatus]|uniref:hypothetical protein n=1 Tax=Streptomyces anulatus TaxID=1892 RepID=UPI0034127D8B